MTLAGEIEVRVRVTRQSYHWAGIKIKISQWSFPIDYIFYKRPQANP
jgi:hypothetical protein